MNRVPRNQKLEWYSKALESYNIGNGGEGKEYQEDELKKVYFQRMTNEDEKKCKALFKLWESIPEDEIVLDIPDVITNCEVIRNRQGKLILIPMVIG